MDLLLLHGALANQQQFILLKNLLEKSLAVHTLDFTGHGANGSGEPFTLPDLVGDIDSYLESLQLSEVALFGYSMGGFLAICYALENTSRINKVITLGTRYFWDSSAADRERKLLDPELVLAKVPAFADMLAQRHGVEHWKSNMLHTASFLSELGIHNYLSAENLNKVDLPVLVLSGDRDSTAPLLDTIAAYRALPNAQLGVLPGTAHALEQVNLPLLVNLIESFLGKEA